MTDAQKREVEKVIHDYIMAHPEVMIDALRGYQERQRQSAEKDAKQAVAANLDAIERDPASPVAGNPNGDVTIVEFFDYHCGYCKKAAPAVQELLKTDPNIRLVFKEFPILGDESVQAAHYALAAWKVAPGKYMPFHVALMEIRGSLSESRILDAAKSVGIDPAKLKAAKDDPAIGSAIEQTLILARTLQVSGTPAFVIGGQLVPGAIDVEAMRDMVKTARDG
ncbi:MAG: DsbA family protein [Rhodospirillales bacterium]|nr:DsbA family protein [Rhodospirillales bacterium]